VAVTAGAAATRWIPGVRRWAFALLAGFSMVGKEDALEQRSRSSLYDYVRANPGTTLSDVQRDVGLGWGTAVYHVSVLERLGMLVTKRVGSKRLLFVQGASRLVDPRALGLMQNPSVRQLALTLLQPGRVVTQAEIAQALDCSPQYAGRLLRKMTSVSLVMPAGETGRRAYQATPMMPEVARRAGLPPTPPAPEAVAAAIVPATA
jgi:predicted transcriptional regulator